MERDYLISNKAYDILTRVVTFVLPAMAVLYLSLSDLWDLPNATAVAGTLAAVATFGGVLLKIADNSWANSNSKYDGEITTTGFDENTGYPHLQLLISVAPETIPEKDTVRLKSVNKAS